MAVNNFTPAQRRRQLIAEITKDAADVEELMHELLRFFAQMQRSHQTARRLGRRLYRLIREAEKCVEATGG